MCLTADGAATGLQELPVSQVDQAAIRTRRPRLPRAARRLACPQLGILLVRTRHRRLGLHQVPPLCDIYRLHRLRVRIAMTSIAILKVVL